MQQPETYVGRRRLVNEESRKFLRSFMQAFAEWIETNLRVDLAEAG